MEHQEDTRAFDELSDKHFHSGNAEQEPTKPTTQPERKEEESFDTNSSDTQSKSDEIVPTSPVEEEHIPEKYSEHSPDRSEQKEEEFDFNKELPSPPAESPQRESGLTFSNSHFEDEKSHEPEKVEEEQQEEQEVPHDKLYPTLQEVINEPVYEANHSKNQEFYQESVKPVIESEPSPQKEEAPKPIEKEEVKTSEPEAPKREPEPVVAAPQRVETPKSESKLPAVIEQPKTRSIKPNKASNGHSFFAHWIDLSQLNSHVLDLVYWRDPRKSGVVLGAILAILLSLSVVSVVSVISYSALAILTGTLSFRLYKNVLQVVQKTQDGHPFKEYLDMDVTVTNEKVHEVADLSAAKLNATLLELRRLFLVEDIVDSIKFGLVLWALTYVGAWFNGLTLVILGVIGVFTLPKVYETHQEKIDQNLDMVRGKINEIVEKVQAALPIGKKAKAQ